MFNCWKIFMLWQTETETEHKTAVAKPATAAKKKCVLRNGIQEAREKREKLLKKAHEQSLVMLRYEPRNRIKKKRIPNL